MDPLLFLRGVVIGFSLAAPVGPIGVLTIRRTLAHGRLTGFVSGLGTATADALYGLIGALGLTSLTALLTAQSAWLGLIGGGFLCYLGVRTFLARPAAVEGALEQTTLGLVGAYISAFGLTLTNPATILAFAVIFAGLNADVAATSALAAMIVVAGVFVGSALWWLVLSTVTGWLRGRLNATALVWVNRLSGVVILAFGVAALARGLWQAA
jgi:threonine/homoserine/homoserine lactone efflux protein